MYASARSLRTTFERFGKEEDGAAGAELQVAVATLRQISNADPSSMAALLLDVLESVPLDQVLPKFRRRCLEREEQLDRELAAA